MVTKNKTQIGASEPRTMMLTAEDKQLVAMIRAKWNLPGVTAPGIIRVALRRMAQAEGINIEPQKQHPTAKAKARDRAIA